MKRSRRGPEVRGPDVGEEVEEVVKGSDNPSVAPVTYQNKGGGPEELQT
jgi:hypothetical protein